MGILVRELLEHVVELRLDRPERMNALSVEMVKAMAEAVSGIAAGRARVVVIAGSGRGFCAGADLKERQGMGTEARLAHNAAINAAVNAVAALPMPTVAAINGAALGGGCELALACDFVIAADTAKFGQPEITLGIIPGLGGSQRLTRMVGKSKAMDLCLTGRIMDAAEAEASGLAARVVPADMLMAEALKAAQKIAAQSSPAAQMVKEAVNRALETSLAEGLHFERRLFHAMFATADQKEGMTAFAEKRKPGFQDK